MRHSGDVCNTKHVFGGRSRLVAAMAAAVPPPNTTYDTIDSIEGDDEEDAMFHDIFAGMPAKHDDHNGSQDLESIAGSQPEGVPQPDAGGGNAEHPSTEVGLVQPTGNISRQSSSSSSNTDSSAAPKKRQQEPCFFAGRTSTFSTWICGTESSAENKGAPNKTHSLSCKVGVIPGASLSCSGWQDQDSY
jgi:hypothetical protein